MVGCQPTRLVVLLFLAGVMTDLKNKGVMLKENKKLVACVSMLWPDELRVYAHDEAVELRLFRHNPKKDGTSTTQPTKLWSHAEPGKTHRGDISFASSEQRISNIVGIMID